MIKKNQIIAEIHNFESEKKTWMKRAHNFQ